MSEGLLTPVDLGAMLGGASADRVLEWNRAYSWPHVRIGRRIFWTPEQVDQITRAHTVTDSKVTRTDGRTARSASRKRAS